MVNSKIVLSSDSIRRIPYNSRLQDQRNRVSGPDFADEIQTYRSETRFLRKSYTIEHLSEESLC